MLTHFEIFLFLCRATDSAIVCVCVCVPFAMYVNLKHTVLCSFSFTFFLHFFSLLCLSTASCSLNRKTSPGEKKIISNKFFLPSSSSTYSDESVVVCSQVFTQKKRRKKEIYVWKWALALCNFFFFSFFVLLHLQKKKKVSFLFSGFQWKKNSTRRERKREENFKKAQELEFIVMKEGKFSL